MHCTAKKGQNTKSKEACNSVFQVGQEEQRRPPGQESEGWVEHNKQEEKKKRMKGTTLEKEKGIQEVNRFQRKEGKMKAVFSLDGEKDKATLNFLTAEEPSHQILVQLMQALLQQAGINK